MIDQAFIFAAGRGERMRPLTDSIPKPLVEVKNRAIIDYSIEKLNKIPQIKKIIINGFYLAEQIEDYIKKLNNPKIIFSHESSKIETGGGLVYAKKYFDENKPLLLINGDILWQDLDGISDIEKICEAYNSSNCDILLGLKKNGDVLGYDGDGDFNFNQENGRLSKISNNPLSHVFVGVQVINPLILKDAPSECFSMSYFYKKALADDKIVNKIKGYELSGRYFHIGDMRALQDAQNALSLGAVT